MTGTIPLTTYDVREAFSASNDPVVRRDRQVMFDRWIKDRDEQVSMRYQHENKVPYHDLNGRSLDELTDDDIRTFIMIGASYGGPLTPSEAEYAFESWRGRQIDDTTPES